MDHGDFFGAQRASRGAGTCVIASFVSGLIGYISSIIIVIIIFTYYI